MPSLHPFTFLMFLSLVVHQIVYIKLLLQARIGRGGVRGGSSEPPLLTSKRFYTSKLHILLSGLPFESGPLVSLLLRITAVQTNLVAARSTVCEFVHRGPAQNARGTCMFTPLR